MKAQSQNHEISASEFKKHCLRLLQEIRLSGKSIIVTKRSTPIAKVVPFETTSNKPNCFGFLSNTITIKGDIVNFSSEDDWEVNNND